MGMHDSRELIDDEQANRYHACRKCPESMLDEVVGEDHINKSPEDEIAREEIGDVDRVVGEKVLRERDEHFVWLLDEFMTHDLPEECGNRHTDNAKEPEAEKEAQRSIANAPPHARDEEIFFDDLLGRFHEVIIACSALASFRCLSIIGLLDLALPSFP